MTRDYRICSRCVMDTSDPEIDFDERGVCNHCHRYDRMVQTHVATGENGAHELQVIVDRIKRSAHRDKYDCVIGVSGGVDSTYVAYKVKQLGLNPLAVHLDNGWDSELAVKNVEQTLKRLGIELYTHVLDWEEFKDLQLSFLKASTPDSEIPSDHAIFALLYQMAEKIGVRYVITGLNVRTESHLPRAWSQGHNDWRYISSVHRRFGTKTLKSYPRYGLVAYLRYRLTQRWIDILNYLDYSKKDAMPILEREIGWKYYGGKHYESIYTRFYQGYILPRKFGFDKRRTHLSSLICSGEMTRGDAIEDLKGPTYDPAQQQEDYEYVIKKLGLTAAEFENMMNSPKRSYRDYPNQSWTTENFGYRVLRKVYRVGVARRLRGA